MNKYLHSLAFLLASLFVIFLTGCGGSGGFFGDSSEDSNSTGARSSLGLVTNAAVNFYAADGMTLLGMGDTGDSGIVTLDVGSYSGPVIIEVVGDNIDAMYFDESAGTLVPFPAGNRLRALVPSPTGTVGVTILTEMAYQLAVINNLIPITSGAITELNEIVRASLAPGLGSILSTPTQFDASTTTGSLTDTEAGRYALILAALAELGNGDATPALTVMNALIQDLADGMIDGQDNGTPLNAPYNNFINEMTAALNSMATTYGDSDLQAEANNQAPASTMVDGSGVSNGGGNTGGGDLVCNSTPATLNNSLAGGYDLIYSQNTPGGPFSDGQMVPATVGADGTLQINGKTLTNPQYCVFSGSPNTAEVIWADSAEQIEYALTDNNSGNFNEINVGDASNPRDFGDTQLPAFLGQLKEGDDTTGGGGMAPAQLTAISGTYNDFDVTKLNSSMSSYALNQDFPFDINGDTGVITVDSQFVLDPSDPSYNFADFSDNFRPRFGADYYQVTQQTPADNGSRWVFDIYVRDGTPVHVQFSDITICGEGCIMTDRVNAEKRPLPDSYTGFFSDAINASPVNLVTVEDSGSVGFAMLCDEFSLTMDNGAMSNSATRNIPFAQLISGDSGSSSGVFEWSFTFLDPETGNRAMNFPGTTITLRQDGFIDYISSPLNTDEFDRLTNDPTEIDAAGCNAGGTPNGDTSPADVNPSIVGTYNLIYEQNMSGGPFTQNQMVTAVVGNDNSLQINGKTLMNPFNRDFGSGPNTFEIIWLDADDQIEYALSDNQNGTFNEINVGDASNAQANGIPAFLGQLTEEAAGRSR